MFIDIEIIAKLFLAETPEEKEEVYGKYAAGIYKIITQYVEDQVYLAQLDEAKLDRINEILQREEEPEKSINEIVELLPDDQKGELFRETDEAVASYNSKIIQKGAQNLTDEELDELYQEIKDTRTELTSVLEEAKARVNSSQPQQPVPQPPIQPERETQPAQEQGNVEQSPATTVSQPPTIQPEQPVQQTQPQQPVQQHPQPSTSGQSEQEPPAVEQSDQPVQNQSQTQPPETPPVNLSSV